MSDWHQYKETCGYSDCGDVIFTCIYCFTDAHCNYFPKNWIRCCEMFATLDCHKFNHHYVFCSQKCERGYMEKNKELLAPITNNPFTICEECDQDQLQKCILYDGVLICMNCIAKRLFATIKTEVQGVGE